MKEWKREWKLQFRVSDLGFGVQGLAFGELGSTGFMEGWSLGFRIEG